MMHKFTKFMTWAYLVVGIIFTVEVFLNWNVDRQKAYVSILMAVLAIFMFFFKRKMQKRNQ